MLRDRIPGLIEVAADEAISFSCNAVVVGKTVILNEERPAWRPTWSSEVSRCDRWNSLNSSNPAAVPSV